MLFQFQTMEKVVIFVGVTEKTDNFLMVDKYCLQSTIFEISVALRSFKILTICGGLLEGFRYNPRRT